MGGRIATQVAAGAEALSSAVYEYDSGDAERDPHAPLAFDQRLPLAGPHIFRDTRGGLLTETRPLLAQERRIYAAFRSFDVFAESASC